MSSREAEEHFDRGLHYFRGGFFPAALQEFGIVKSLDPAYPNIAFIVEAARKRAEEVAGKLDAFIEEEFDRQIVELSEQLVYEGSRSFAQEIEQLLRKGLPEAALEKLRQADSIVPESKPLLLVMASIQRRLGRFSEAENTLLRARTLFPKDAEVLNNLGNVYLSRNLFRIAEDQFQEARKLAPDDVRILNNLGALKMQSYRLDDARECFEEALARNPKSRVVSRNLDNVQLRIRTLDEEISRLRQEFYAHPTFLDIGLALGKALLFRGFIHEARSMLNEVVAKNPALIAAHFYLGTIFELEGSLGKAIEHFREMVVRKKKQNTPIYKAFESLLQEDYQEEALFELKKLAVLDLDLAASHINLGIRYFEDALWDEALRHFEEAASLNQSYPDAPYWVAMCLLQQGKKAAAEKHLLQALALNPRYADAHFQLGMLYHRKSVKKAAQHLQQAIDLGLRPSFAALARKHLPAKDSRK
ncbi:MAG: tetratricopeptide repeat protein [Candidatus Riflebacteria bacterium]|nr:tetratricopeptide repeat protein [Candidatus Riflebacteria bacterium]